MSRVSAGWFEIHSAGCPPATWSLTSWGISGLNKRWRTTEGYSLENKPLKCVKVGPTVLSHWPTTEACFVIDAGSWD